MRDGADYKGYDPGAYRVIFTRYGGKDGGFCGILSHPVSERASERIL